LAQKWHLTLKYRCQEIFQRFHRTVINALVLSRHKQYKPQSRFARFFTWRRICCAATWCLSERGYHV